MTAYNLLKSEMHIAFVIINPPTSKWVLLTFLSFNCLIIYCGSGFSQFYLFVSYRNLPAAQKHNKKKMKYY